MLTVVLAPEDRSRSAWGEEMSNPLRIASSKWAEGFASMTSSCSGSAPSLSPSRSDRSCATKWGGSSFGPGLSPGLLPVSLSDSSVSGTWVRKGSCFSCLTTGLGLNIAGAGPCSVFGDSASPGRRMSRPGVRGNDVIGDATGPTSVIRSLDPGGPDSCCSGDTSGCSGSEGITTTDRTDGVDSRSSTRSWR